MLAEGAADERDPECASTGKECAGGVHPNALTGGGGGNVCWGTGVPNVAEGGNVADEGMTRAGAVGATAGLTVVGTAEERGRVKRTRVGVAEGAGVAGAGTVALNAGGGARYALTAGMS